MAYKYALMTYRSLNILNSEKDDSTLIILLFFIIRVRNIDIYYFLFPFIQFRFQTSSSCCCPRPITLLISKSKNHVGPHLLDYSIPEIFFPSLAFITCLFWFFFHILNHLFSVTFVDSCHPYTVGFRVQPFLSS